MKKPICLILAALLTLPLYCACADDSENVSSEAGEASYESGVSEMSEAAEEKIVFTVGKASIEAMLTDSDKGNDGIFVFSESGRSVSAPVGDSSFVDAVIADGAICAAYPAGFAAIVPENGYVVRMRGSGEGIAVGSAVKGLDTGDCMPSKYVRFGAGRIEFGNENATRFNDIHAYFYDKNWYAASTLTDGGFEIAVDADGTVVSVSESGNTYIPDGGYVLSLSSISAGSNIAAKLRVGETAELVRSSPLYTVKRLIVSGRDKTRTGEGNIIYTHDKNTVTPGGDGTYTEIAVNSAGRITGIFAGVSGGTEIPDGGYVISCAGLQSVIADGYAKKYMYAAFDGKQMLRLVDDPVGQYLRLIDESESIRTKISLARDEFLPLDYKTLDTLESSVVGLPYNPYELDGNGLAKAILLLTDFTDTAGTLIYPSITVGDRTAWVTVGELGYSDEIILHYRNETDVRHAVEYAKGIGLNTLIVDNLAAGYAVYPSKLDGMVMLPELDGFDVLDAFSRACRENGMRLIVMMPAFPIATSHRTWEENHFMNTMKDKYLLTNKGRYCDNSGTVTLDPADGEVLAFSAAIAKEIAENYDIFGIQIDYARYPLPIFYQEHNYEDYGYNPTAAKKFEEKYGVSPASLSITDPLWDDWCAMRRDVISNAVRTLYETVKGVDGGLNMTFTCFADYNDRQKYVYQDVEKWARDGYADAVYPMIYGNTVEYQTGYIKQNLPIGEYAPVVIGVGTYVRSTQEDYARQLTQHYDFAVAGTSDFTLRYISVCGYDATTRKVFREAAVPVTGADRNVLFGACLDMLKVHLEAYRQLDASPDYDRLFEDVSALAGVGDAERPGALKAIDAAAYGGSEKATDAIKRELSFIIAALSH